MRKLSVVTGVLILVVSGIGFKLSRFGTAGLRRWKSVVHMDCIDDVCQKVVSDQPAVLLLADGDPRRFSHWEGERLKLDSSGGRSSNPAIMPFVDRINTVTDMTRAVADNLEQAEDIQSGSHAVKKSLRLVGSGASFGAGKTTIGPVLHQCLEGMLAKSGKNRKVVYAYSEIGNKKSTYDMWMEDVCSKPGMEGLSTVINKDMYFEEVVQATERYLSNRDIVMFLHLDEFAPFDDAGRTQNTPEEFYDCWQQMLMPILCSPSIGLYVSGRMAYFDTVSSGESGQSPCNVLSAQLDLFTADTIHTMLQKISIPRSNIIKEDTVPLSKALDRLFPTALGHTSLSLPQQGFGALDVAQRLHDVTGGVPRFVEHALFALLTNSAMYTSLFECDGTFLDTALLDKLFVKGGGVYNAVDHASSVHFESVGAACAREEDRVKTLTGLMQLLFLRDRSFVLSQDDISDLSSARFSSDDGRPICQLVANAQFWGIHRTIERDREGGGGRISFPLPPAVLDGLASAFAGWWNLLPDRDGADECRQATDTQLGDKAERKVHASLAFHRLVTALLPHTNWLGLVEDPKDPVTLLQRPAATEPATLSSGMWDLPRLPVVRADGEMRGVDAVRRSVLKQGKQGTKSKAAKEDKKNYCGPALLGEFLSSFSSKAFHAFCTTPQSASADFIVRYGRNVTHLQVRNANYVNLTTVLEACGKVAPIVKASSELQHTLVFVIEGTEVRCEAKQLIGHLSGGDLAQKLKVELKNVATKEIESDESKHKQMRLAINLIKKGTLKVEVLDDHQHKRFSRNYELAKYLRGGGWR